MKNRITITVTLFGEDSSFGNRQIFRDAVNDALLQAQLGMHIGGGTMVTEEPHYNVEFEVTDESAGLVLVFQILRSMNASSATEVSIGDRRYHVYDDTWTDLGPRQQRAPQAIHVGPNVSPQDFLAQLQQIAADAKKQHGGPKDPNRKA
jgi:hypothetical protein